ncbi:Long chain acyl-CoA synthetase 7 peroxisomal [Blyttiomyces sp. JEL0837]|nr:Long chain acyl-CoA synthetase 7 peroxisomal [Blyttiomyces sp. JEL0837]
MSNTTIYSKEVVHAPEIPGEGKPRRNAFLKNGLVALPEGINSLYENFLSGVKASGPFVWQSYNEIHKRVKNLGSGMVKRGLKANANIGLFSINRAEWVIAEQSCFMFSLVTVPLYDTLGAEAIEYIANQTNLSMVLATKDKAKIMLELKPKLHDLKTVIIMDASDEDVIALGKRHGVEVVSILDVEREGAQAPLDAIPPTPSSVGTICYTSGTTGQPKGVVLSHANMLGFSAAVGELHKTGRFIGINKDDVYISYLPLAHVFERICQILVTQFGGRIGFYQGDTLKLLDDVAELKPTIFASVPRLYNRIFDKVMAGVKAKGGVSQYLFNTAFAAKKNNLANGQLTHWLWDRVVFSAVKARLGGRVRMLLTGAAPISAEVIDFLRICFSSQVYEGYGQTETCAGLSVTDQHDFSSGHVGVPVPCCEVKLRDVPEMGYTSKDTPFPRGEIVVRGGCVFQEYYKSPEKTAEVLDAQGWCRTGDIGMWDSQGRLKIVDRVKNIFKLAQGEYIAPEKIEVVYQKHELVAQAFVYGDSLQATLVGIIVPDEDQIKLWAREKGFGEKSVAELCRDEAVKKAFLKTLEDRHEAKKKYETVIDAMYAASG